MRRLGENPGEVAGDHIKEDVIFQTVGSQCGVSSESVTIRFDFLRNHTGKLPCGSAEKEGEPGLRSCKCMDGRGQR